MALCRRHDSIDGGLCRVGGVGVRGVGVGVSGVRGVGVRGVVGVVAVFELRPRFQAEVVKVRELWMVSVCQCGRSRRCGCCCCFCLDFETVFKYRWRVVCGFVLDDDDGWGFGCRRMICRQWGSGNSTVAFG